MPTYNEGNYIRIAIKSILLQSLTDFEFLIIDDGSTDDTEYIVKSFIDERIKYFKCEHKGISNALNFGLLKSSYEIVARMDADDIAVPTRLEEQLNFLNRNRDYDLVSSWYALFKNRNIKYIIRTVEKDSQIKNRLLLHSEIVHPGVMYRKAIIEKYGGYKTDGVEDYELWLKIKNEAKFYNIQKVLTFLRIVENSSSRSNRSEIRDKQYSVQIPFYENLKENFGLGNEAEENEFKGWREYFYGNKIKAKKYWFANKIRTITNFRLLIALFSIFLPDKIYQKIRGASIRLKLKYIINYFSNDNCNLRVAFNKLITSLEVNTNILE